VDAGDDDTGRERPRAPRHDPAAPHTAPLPSAMPRWLAWLVLVALAGSGVLCAKWVVG
jgi:hypothetical protein